MALIEMLIFLSTILPIFHLVNALVQRRRKQDPKPLLEKPFTLVIPCYNEQKTVGVSVGGLLSMAYKNYNAVYVNDGSTDRTLETLRLLLELYETPKPAQCPKCVRAVYRSANHEDFLVVDQYNGGKSEALNTGIFFSDSELIVTLDADSVLKRDALTRMNAAFMDDRVVAAGGAIHIMQGYDPVFGKNSGARQANTLIALQVLEYLKGFYIYKMSLSKQQATAIISGAFGVFRKKVLVAAGGFRKSLGEDIDITMRIQQLIHRSNKKILYLPDALCYTQCPENWHDLRRQRMRWQKGFIDCAVHQKKFLCKTFLLRSVSFHFVVEALIVGICSCVFTVFTHVIVLVYAFFDARIVVIFLYYYAFCVTFHLLYSACAIRVANRFHRYPATVMKRIWKAVVMDILFYRYFCLFMYLGGTLSYFWNEGGKLNWNKCERIEKEFAVLKI
jgi:cellulose synthase/poly-beta-1,6-N-acetylglucosamine synthase-like glycosyltransferase